MKPSIIRTPGGEELVLLTVAEFEALRDAVDAADHARAMADIRAGAETLSAEEVLAGLDEPTLLAFWRKKRGLSEAALARAAGLSVACLASLEDGRGVGDPAQILRLARALGLRMEDLVSENTDARS